MRKSFYFIAIFSLFAFFTGCEVGMGQALDLEAPVITVTSPEKFSYQQLSFRLTGTCKDNIKVESVTISNKETGRVYGNASISGTDWTFDINLAKEEEGEITLLCEANDSARNTSTRSARSITLLVDENAPEAKFWYMDRGNSKQTQLKEKQFLENLDFNKAENKDYPQNQKFTLYGDFYDAMGIDEITVKLFDDEVSETSPIIEKTVSVNASSSNYIGDGYSIYSPSFVFTESEFLGVNSNYNTGKHYFRVAYYARDINNEDPSRANSAERDTEKYILWYPQSDRPGVQQNSINSEGKVRVSVGSSISVDFFDDDGLSEIYLALKNTISGTGSTETERIASYAETLRTSSSARSTAFTAGTNQPAVSKTDFSTVNFVTDFPKEIDAPGIPGQMYLICAAKDVNPAWGTSTAAQWNTRVIPVEVVDSAKPMLFIESPVENEMPTMKDGSETKFDFKGYSLDTKGSDYIKIVYVPVNDANRESRAKELLTQYKNDTTAKKVISGTGEVIWYKKITGSNVTDGWNKQLFEIEMDLFNDFKNASGASTATSEKFFEICLVDTDGNEVLKPFVLNGDSLQPSIDIKKPIKELAVHDYTVTDGYLEIQFKGQKHTGIGMQADKYKVTTRIGTETKTFTTTSTPAISSPDTNGYVTLIIPNTTLTTWAATESQPTFTFYATDKLGNGGLGEDMRSVILNPKPQIEQITVDKNNATYKAGTEMNFKVQFTKQVKVTGTPKLKIKYSASDTVENVNKLAVYESGSGSNALTFKWTVPAGAVSTNGIVCEGFALDPEAATDPEKADKLADGARICATELGEGDVYTSLSNAEVLAGKSVKLDGVAPTITDIEVRAVDGNNYCTKDKKIEVTLTMSEKVLVSGSPNLSLRAINGSSSNEIKFSFEKMNTEDKTITFIHTVTNAVTPATASTPMIPKTPEGQIRYVLESCFSSTDAQYLSDEVGNTLSLSNNAFADTSVYVDYTPPAVAPGVNLEERTYNEEKEVELLSLENGATGYYSKNGGVSWSTYDSLHKETLSNGTYQIKTYQTDMAGNKSSESGITTVVINGVFAPVTNFSIDLADGNYKKDVDVPFVLNFDNDVILNAATDIKVKFLTMEAGKTTYREVNADVPETIPADGYKTNAVTFTYKVGETDDFKGIKVTEVTFDSSLRDENGNQPHYAGTEKKLTPTNCAYLDAEDGGKRSGINLDGVAPTITDYTPAMTGTGNAKVSGIASMTDNSAGSFKITLTFSEDVYKEAGTIILQRKAGWYIPPVLGLNEFTKYYNKMTPQNKAKMMRLAADSTSDELLHSKTGIAVGPYRKITHGLTTKNGKYVPDDQTKYVLAYELGIDSGEKTLDTGVTASVEDIRSALESVEYHRHKVDVSSTNVKVTGGNTVEITFAEAIEDGREWELIIPPKAFRDNTENFYKGMNLDKLTEEEKTKQTITTEQENASDKYSLWSNNVAQPVVRVDRYTHGWGAHEPKADGTFTDITVNNGKYKTNIAANSAAKTAPTGYCRVRIDCETPGAQIKYSKIFNDGTVYTTVNTTANPPVAAGTLYTAGTKNDNTDYHTNKRTEVGDITVENLAGTSTVPKRGVTNYTAGADIIVGDGLYTTARKDYITAYATKSGYEPSLNGYEGVFKTIVYISSSRKVAALNIEGGTAAGGQPSVNGFPLRDATDENDPTGTGRFSKNCYAVDDTTMKNFVFVSYEIISNNWAILVCGTNHSRDYPLNSYGCSAYITKQVFWSGTNVE